MNIIYLLTNKSKSTGRRFYVGSKTDCKIVKINGVDTIVSVRTGKPYYSSSTSEEFRNDISSGDTIEATILEQVPVKYKKSILEVENKWIKHYNAVDSPEFYNKAYALYSRRPFKQVLNKYGELCSEYTHRCSNMAKRDNSAKSFGYANFGEFYFAMYDRLCAGESFSQVARSLNKHKGYIRVAIKNYDMEKAKRDLLSDKSSQIRAYMREGCSLYKACELLDIEIPAGRVMLGDYLEDRNFSVALNQGLSVTELEVLITKRILDGGSIRDLSNEFGIVYESVKRYFIRCLRRNIKSSDIK